MARDKTEMHMLRVFLYLYVHKLESQILFIISFIFCSQINIETLNADNVLANVRPFGGGFSAGAL